MTQTNSIGSQPLIGTRTDTLIDKTERTATAPAQGDTPPSRTASPVDAANLSGLGSVLSAATSATDEVRTAKVTALKSAIDSGTYNIPVADVADKLIRNMLE